MQVSAADGAEQIRAIVLTSVVGGAGEIGANGLINNCGFSSIFCAKVNFFKIRIFDMCPSFTLAPLSANTCRCCSA